MKMKKIEVALKTPAAVRKAMEGMKIMDSTTLEDILAKGNISFDDYTDALSTSIKSKTVNRTSIAIARVF